MDRLPPEAKRLVQTAAVIGMQMTLPLLQTVTGLSEADLHTGLSHLQVAELLYETQVVPELMYTFKHALTHEVVYGSLLQEWRRTLHARIVETLEALYPDRLAEQVDRLAHHAMRAQCGTRLLRIAARPGLGRWPARRIAKPWRVLSRRSMPGAAPERRDTLA